VVISTIDNRVFGSSDGDWAFDAQTGYMYATGVKHTSVVSGTERIAVLESGGEYAVSIAADGVRGWVYVVNEYTDNVTVIRGTEVITAIVTLGSHPLEAAIDPNTGWVYVVSLYRKKIWGDVPITEGNVLVISGTQMIGNIPIGTSIIANHLAVDSVNNYVYVSTGNKTASGDIDGGVIVVEGLEKIGEYPMRGPAKDMSVNPTTGEVYVLTSDDLYHFSAGQFVDSVEIPGHLWAMRVHPSTGDVYVARGSNVDSVILVLRDMQVVAEVPAGGGPAKMAIDPFTGNVYVANFEDNTVTVINGTEQLATIQVGWYPYGIGVNPTNGWVYVSNINDGTISVLGYP
jgi:YVTN family beta-propeller protein